jgi:hypothetical protein
VRDRDVVAVEAEQHGQALGGIDVVVDDQDACSRRRAAWHRSRAGTVGAVEPRQAHDELAARPGPSLGGADAAAVQLDELLH